MARWVLHVDLDQFIAAVEVLRRPELRGRPVVVGGDGDPTKRGVVSTASYEAREYGIGSGMPLRVALRRCPDAVFLAVDKDVYDAVSVRVMDVLRDFGVVEVLGWDEAFVGADSDDPEARAWAIQRRVREQTDLYCSVGIGENRLQAKIATGFGKPAGVFRLTAQTWFDVLGESSPEALWGIGRKTARRLSELGIHTVNQLAAADPADLARVFGPSTGPWLVQLAWGRASAHVSDTPHVPRSRSREETFQQDVDDWDTVAAEVERLARRVADDVNGQAVSRVVVKIRYVPFDTRTHGHTPAAPITDASALAAAARDALERFDERRPVRLVGVRAEFVD